MKTLLVIGIGAGDPAYVTAQAAAALNRADVFLVMDKGLPEMVALRRQICDRFVTGPYRFVTAPDPPRELDGPDYSSDVRAWHRQRVAVYGSLIAAEVPEGGAGAFLVWGDPALYDSTLRMVDELVAAAPGALAVEVVPGISAPQALAARHGITLHGIGEPVLITTGRRLVADFGPSVPGVVVMLDGDCAFRSVDAAGVSIYWGAYLGTPDEILVAGPLAAVADEIVERRARAKATKGWMFDTYLLRRA